MRTMTFLVNPPTGARRKMATKTKSKRKPPKGFRTWGAYMASIRPGGKRRKGAARARSNPEGTTMARDKRRKATHHKSAARHTARAHIVTTSAPRKRGKHRRNPPGFLKAAPAFVGGVLVGAVSTTVGTGIARAGRGLLKLDGQSVVGMATEALIGLVVGMGAAMAGAHQIGRDIAVGGVQSPLRSAAQRMLPGKVGTLLGADDYYLGFSDAVDAVQSGQLAGYVDGPTGSRFAPLGDDAGLGASETGARYVQGA